MNVSVIIPVYNAAPYLAESVKSALGQPESHDVILIEDGSSDSSFAHCQELAKSDSRIQLFRHEGGHNRGASASRNLGIANAKCGYVAFLDADDFYLPNRFSVARAVFARDKDADAVYEAIGTHFENEAAAQVWKQIKGPLLTTIQPGIAPETLFEAQSPIGSAGHCSLVGLTIKRHLFDKTGPFDLELRLHQDTAFFMKLAACARLIPGEVTKPVAMRRVHCQNRTSRHRSVHTTWNNRLKMWLAVRRWLTRHDSSRSRELLLIGKMLWECNSIISSDWTKSKCFLVSLWRSLQILHHDPTLITERMFTFTTLKYLRNLLAERHVYAKNNTTISV